MNFIFAVLLFAFSFNALGEESIQVVSVKGLVNYGGEYLKEGQTIAPGQLIDSSGKASVIIEYPGGKKLQLKAARARLNSAEAKGSQIELLAGTVFGWFKKDKKKKTVRKPFKIKTRGVVAGVRGTKFMIEEQPEKTYLCVCEGEVAIQKKESEVLLKKGYDLWDKKGAENLKTPKYAQKRMLEMVAKSVSEMGGTTEPYWEQKSWKGED